MASSACATSARSCPGTPDRTGLVKGNGRDAASVSVSQQVGANMLEIEAGVAGSGRTSSRKRLPAGLHITKVYDLAEFVRASIANVRDAILIGGVLAVIVLLVFLRDWRLTLVAAITLPLAVLSTFVVMRLFGESINLMSMGGLAVAIGLVIDDAVVVVEGIHRRVQRRLGDARSPTRSPIDRARRQLDADDRRRLRAAGSAVRRRRTVLPRAVADAVGRGARVAGSRADAHSAAARVGHPALARADARRPDGRLDDLYARTLRPILGAPAPRARCVALVLAAPAAPLYLSVGSGFLPRADEGGFVVDYQTPAGTALEETDRQLKKVEAVLLKTPEVAAIQRRTGSELGLFATQQNTRRHPRASEAARPTQTAPPRRSSRICATSWPKPRRAWRSSSCSCCRTCSATSKATPRRSKSRSSATIATLLAEIAEQVEELLGKIEGRRRHRRRAERQPGADLADRSRSPPAGSG